MAKKKFIQPAKITDGVDTNNFGVLFHSTKAIELFQDRSGMKGAYTTEYQHHYLSLIARLEADGQIMDLCIPLAMYNYHQEVGGASVEFNLGEVGEANNEAQEMAMTKYNEFIETDMYKSLVAMGFENFVIEGMHSIHAHPNGINRFSGTDLRENIDHPGVNFPLSVGVNVANFASIIQHRENHAQIIHTEYRMFNGTADGDKVYKKGRTLTVVKGFEVALPKPEAPKEPGLIDKLFGVKPPPPVTPAKPKYRPNYFLEDGFVNAEKETFDNLKNELMKMWVECPFSIDVSLVLKTNVLKGRGRLLAPTHTTTYGGTRGRTGKHNVAGINEGLFGAWAKTGGNKPETETLTYPQKRLYLLRNEYTHQDLNGQTMAEIEELYQQVKLEEEEEAANTISAEFQESPPAFWEMKKYLVERDVYSWMQMNGFTPEEIEDAYWLERLDEEEDKAANIVPEDEEAELGEMIMALLDVGFTPGDISSWGEDEVKIAYDLNFPGGDPVKDQVSETSKESMMEFLIAIGFTHQRLTLMNDDVLKETYEINMNKAGNDEVEANGDENFTRTEMMNMLVADKIMERSSMITMGNASIVKIFNETYCMDEGAKQ